jgi:hypothetical protein
MDSSRIVEFAEIGVAVGTWVVALYTARLVKGHRSAAEEQRKILLSTAEEQRKILLSTAEEQRNIQLYLELRKDFDSQALIDARRSLAEHLLDRKPHHEIINQRILTFFEDLGMLVRHNSLDLEMVWHTFGHFAKMWWSACREYMATERSKLRDDRHFFGDFEFLVEQIYNHDINRRISTRADLEPKPSEVESFLLDEAQRLLGSSLKAA